MTITALQDQKKISLRRPFSVAEYHQMIHDHILHEDDRLELIQGDILTMTPIAPRHARCVRQLIRLLTRHIGDAAILDVQNPIQLDPHTEPQPDVVLLQLQDKLYPTHPGPHDVLLLIEVADSSLHYDQEVKCPLYAEAGIREVWLVNLPEMRLEVYRQPTPEGYRERVWLWPDDTVTPQAFPDVNIPVEEMLGA